LGIPPDWPFVEYRFFEPLLFQPVHLEQKIMLLSEPVIGRIHH
jgi:hypothetical protein